VVVDAAGTSRSPKKDSGKLLVTIKFGLAELMVYYS